MQYLIFTLDLLNLEILRYVHVQEMQNKVNYICIYGIPFFIRSWKIRLCKANGAQYMSTRSPSKTVTRWIWVISYIIRYDFISKLTPPCIIFKTNESQNHLNAFDLKLNIVEESA